MLFALSCHKSIHSIDCVQRTQLIPVYAFSFFRNSYLSQSTPLCRSIFFCIFSYLFPCSAYFSLIHFLFLCLFSIASNSTFYLHYHCLFLLTPPSHNELFWNKYNVFFPQLKIDCNYSLNSVFYSHFISWFTHSTHTTTTPTRFLIHISSFIQLSIFNNSKLLFFLFYSCWHKIQTCREFL